MRRWRCRVAAEEAVRSSSVFASQVIAMKRYEKSSEAAEARKWMFDKGSTKDTKASALRQ